MEMLPMKVLGVFDTTHPILGPTGNLVVLLQEIEGQRQLPIFIDGHMAWLIDLTHRRVEKPRPMTNDLFSKVLGKMGAGCLKVEIDDLRQNVYFATIFIGTGEGDVLEFDSRPSDAILLALTTKSPIFVAGWIVDAQAINPESSMTTEEEERLALFRDFVESLDFGPGHS